MCCEDPDCMMEISLKEEDIVTYRTAELSFKHGEDIQMDDASPLSPAIQKWGENIPDSAILHIGAKSAQ